MKIDFVRAIIGGEVEVETIHGPVIISIPQGTQPGEIKKISGKGIKNNSNGQLGSHYVTILVDLPK